MQLLGSAQLPLPLFKHAVPALLPAGSPMALSWVRERVMTSMCLEHETKPSEREQTMTQRLQGCLFLQAANPRPS